MKILYIYLIILFNFKLKYSMINNTEEKTIDKEIFYILSSAFFSSDRIYEDSKKYNRIIEESYNGYGKTNNIKYFFISIYCFSNIKYFINKTNKEMNKIYSNGLIQESSRNILNILNIIEKENKEEDYYLTINNEITEVEETIKKRFEIKEDTSINEIIIQFASKLFLCNSISKNFENETKKLENIIQLINNKLSFNKKINIINIKLTIYLASLGKELSIENIDIKTLKKDYNIEEELDIFYIYQICKENIEKELKNKKKLEYEKFKIYNKIVTEFEKNKLKQEEEEERKLKLQNENNLIKKEKNEIIEEITKELFNETIIKIIEEYQEKLTSKMFTINEIKTLLNQIDFDKEKLENEKKIFALYLLSILSIIIFEKSIKEEDGYTEKNITKYYLNLNYKLFDTLNALNDLNNNENNTKISKKIYKLLQNLENNINNNINKIIPENNNILFYIIKLTSNLNCFFLDIFEEKNIENKNTIKNFLEKWKNLAYLQIRNTDSDDINDKIKYALFKYDESFIKHILKNNFANIIIMFFHISETSLLALSLSIFILTSYEKLFLIFQEEKVLTIYLYYYQYLIISISSLCTGILSSIINTKLKKYIKEKNYTLLSKNNNALQNNINTINYAKEQNII